MGRRTKRGKGIPRLIQIRFDDAGPCLRRLLDLSRKSLCNHGRAFICQQVIKVLIRA